VYIYSYYQHDQKQSSKFEKPIFTQWTFAPAEPNPAEAKTKKPKRKNNKAREAAQLQHKRLGYTEQELIGKLNILKMATEDQQRTLIVLSKKYVENEENYLDQHAKKLNKRLNPLKLGDDYKKALESLFYELLSDVGHDIKNSKDHNMKNIDNIIKELQERTPTHATS